MVKKVDETMLDGLLASCKTPADVDALYSQLLQRVINRSLDAELDAHLGYVRAKPGHPKFVAACETWTPKVCSCVRNLDTQSL